MKIAQLTLNGYYNYGNILQKYALNRVLKRYADEVDVLWFEEDNFLPETWEWNWRPKLISMFNSAEARRQFTFEISHQTVFKLFYDRHISTRYDISSLEDIADDYDYFVVGSDQVWNPNFPFAERFLSFAQKEKRIAYAASIAIPSIPNNLKEVFRRGISEIPNISVREKEAAKIIKELTGINPIVLIDPTLMLTVEEWQKLSQKPSWFDKKYNDGYILTYFLRGEVPSLINEEIKKLNLPVINLFDLNNFNYYTVGIEGFLFLVENASIVYTNSFHGTLFSILYERPVVVCHLAKDVAAMDMTSRIHDLLKNFKLEDRELNTKNDFHIDSPFEVDYSQKEDIIEREKAKNFLTKAFLRHHKGGGYYNLRRQPNLKLNKLFDKRSMLFPTTDRRVA